MLDVRTHVIMRPEDNVATAISYLEKSATILLDQGGELKICADQGIDFGHKFAIAYLRKGTDIVKYGEVIGIASTDIQAGEHVHIHNVDGKRGRGDVNDES